jgi:oligoribonuclease
MSLPFKPSLFWVDLEMSGLDPLYNRILEFACILTDSQLKHQQPGPQLIIHCDEAHLKTMDEWNTTYLP